MTFRFHGHVFGDADGYMDKEEKRRAVEADPYPRFRQALIDDGHATGDELSQIEAEVSQNIEDAVQFALGCTFPSADELRRDVFAEELAA